MFQSIRWRIAVPFVLLILSSMIGMGVYVSNFIENIYLQDLKNQLITNAISARESLKSDFASRLPGEFLDDQARDWAALLNLRVTLIDADGKVIGESHDNRERMDNHSDRSEIQQAIDLGQGSSIRFSHTAGYDMLYGAVPVESEGSRLGFIRLALPLLQIEASIRNLQQVILIFSLLIAIIAILLAMWIASRTTKPLRRLTQAAGRMSSGRLDSQIVPTTSDEVGQLTNAFNSMAGELRSYIGALETEKGKLAAVLASMSDGVIIIDRQGTIQLINPAAEAMFGVTSNDVLGFTLIEAIRMHQLVELWQSCLNTNELQVITLDIPIRRIYLYGMATSLSNALPGSTLLLFQDLTRIRRLETVRQDFMTNISHELRTPIASLKALAETLNDSALDDPPAARHFIQQIDLEVDALNLMVSELLELSRIESGRVPLKMQSTSSQELINQAVERLELQAERAGLTITKECQTDLPPVLADPLRLEQVIVNLLHNAIKFTPSGGRIDIGCQQVNENIQFFIRDTGMGITTNDLPRIFERFYKSDRARSGGGTGLGLAIARHLVEAHGGQIWAESAEGIGSTFYFTVPLTH
jgi:two-component system, OmpR family, phosphate regulon sensor histidine kinase PhoR